MSYIDRKLSSAYSVACVKSVNRNHNEWTVKLFKAAQGELGDWM